jgi:hypothetical protein
LLLFAKNLKYPDPVALNDKIDVALFIEALLQRISYKVLGFLRLSPEARKLV